MVDVNSGAKPPKTSIDVPRSKSSLNSLAECLDKLYPGAQPAFFKRSDFPKDFVFGSATAAFQIEGGLDKHCRGHTTWDKFADEHGLFKPYGPDAVNHVEKFEEDVKLMKDIGFDSYRFSISWSRILPCGRGMKSEEGIKFYKNLIKTLKDHGIEPFVTLFHWDLPLDLQDKYHGFLSLEIVEDFGNYAKICFEEFGDDVNHWITLNEPYNYAFLAHVNNVHAPAYGTVTDHFYSTTTATTQNVTNRGRRIPNHRPPSAVDCLKTKEKVTVFCPPCTEKYPDPFAFPYIVTHNMLLAHGQAVKEFRSYQELEKAERANKEIGITLVSMWFEPRNPECGHDKAAARRALDFFLGWYLDPLVHGEYPESMQQYVKSGHLPEMTAADRKLIKGSYDFIGVNYYTARYVGYKVAKEKHLKDGRNYITDQHLKYYETCVFKNGKEAVPIGKKGSSAWLISHPEGIEKLLLHIKNKYKDPIIYITENGLDDKDDGCTKQWSSLGDQNRMIYIRDHLKFLLEAIKKGVQVKGYFAWSLLDNFEWDSGFKVRFGLVYVDYKDGSKRYPKLSAQWFKHFLANIAGDYINSEPKVEKVKPIVPPSPPPLPEPKTIVDFTIPIPAQTAAPRVRPAAHSADPEYITKFEMAIKLMKELPVDDPRNFLQQANIYRGYLDKFYSKPGYNEADLDVHNSWLFFPFHRWYGYFFERICGKLIGDPNFAIPFWNWDVPSGMTIPQCFANPNSPLYDPLRDPAHQPPNMIDLDFNGADSSIPTAEGNMSMVYRQLGRLFFTGFGLDNAPLNTIYRWTGDRSQPHGENMGNLYSAANDPIFFAHHANFDRLWAGWDERKLGGSRWHGIVDRLLDTTFIFYDENARMVRVRAGDCMKITNLGYQYEDVGIEWLNHRPKPRLSVDERRSVIKNIVDRIGIGNQIYPIQLNKAVTLALGWEHKRRQFLVNDKDDEFLLLQDIVAQREKFVKFDIYVNDEGKSSAEDAEYVWSFVHVPIVNDVNFKEETFTTNLKVSLTGFLDDLEAEKDKYVVITLVPRAGYDDAKIGGIQIEYESKLK